MTRAAYRVRQFFQYLPGARMTTAQVNEGLALLGPALSELFQRMTPGEQAHSYRVLTALKARGATDREVLAAALLHDVGKILAPLNVVERTAVVLTRKFAPRWAREWGGANGRRRAFVVAERHAEWGTELAERAGASPRLVSLIRRHQIPAPVPPLSEEDRLLRLLQEADEES